MGINLTDKPIPELIKKLALPASIGFFFNTMFNVVDTFYSGMLSTDALAALSASFPVFFIILSFASGLGTGTNALVSNSIGESKYKRAKLYSLNALSLSFIISIILTILGYNYMPHIFKILKSEGKYLEYSVEYMRIISMGTVFFIMNNVLNGILGAQGDTKTFRNYVIVGFFLNIIFDPIFMFGFWKIPAMGVKGVALATFIIQIIGFIYLSIKVKNSSILRCMRISEAKPVFKHWKTILGQAIPAIINMLTISAGIFTITYFASMYGGQDAVAAFGIAVRIEQLALLPTIGLNVAVISIAGQNFGAKKYARIEELKKIAILIGVSIIMLGILIIVFMSEQLIRIFSNDLSVISQGKIYLKIDIFTLNAYIILNIFASLLQGIKKPAMSIVIGLTRQVILPVPVYLLLGTYFGMGIKGVWIGVFVITWIGAIMMYLAFTKIFNRIKRESEEF